MIPIHLLTVFRVVFLSFAVCLRSSRAFSVRGGGRHHPPTSTSLMAAQPSNKLTDWVVENLEGGDLGSVTSLSTSKAGENDTLPSDGLSIAGFRILPSDSSSCQSDSHHIPIRILGGRNGWGTGVHPTTRLCLEWLSNNVQDGDTVLDYGCGSSILSIAALHLSAARAIGVDVEAEALVTSTRNMELNGFEDRFEGLHTREILPFDLCRPTGVDVCVANILIGQLVRPSMVSAIMTNIRPNGLVCFSGIRPHEVDSLKEVYGSYVNWIDNDYAELSAQETEGSIESYGFDVGTWSRLVGRVKENGGIDTETMSELAVS